jgi:LytS/YehU family sensor histidine kinase
MKKFLQKLVVVPFMVGFMMLLMNMTSPINSSSILENSSAASNDFSVFMVTESWTWTQFAGAAVVGGVSGALGGAVAGAWIGAAVGAVGGTVGGAAAYAGTQAWDYFFGKNAGSGSDQILSYNFSEAVLD